MLSNNPLGSIPQVLNYVKHQIENHTVLLDVQTVINKKCGSVLVKHYFSDNIYSVFLIKNHKTLGLRVSFVDPAIKGFIYSKLSENNIL